MTVPLARERLAINGVDLEEIGVYASNLSGLYTVPAKRGDHVAIAGRHGGLRKSARVYDVNEFAFPVTIMGDTDAELSNNLARFLDLITGSVTITHTRSDGTPRQCVAEVIESLEPERLPGYPETVKLAVAFSSLTPFWTDVEDVTSRVVLTSGATAKLWEFAGATAPMDRLTAIIGPAWNVTLIDARTGGWVAYDGPIQQSESLILDCAKRQASGGGGMIVDQGRIRRGGARGRLFELSPGNPPSIALTSTGPDPVEVQVSGKRCYLSP